MNDHPRSRLWAPWILAAIASVGVGIVAFNAGVTRGLAANPQVGSTPFAGYPFWFHPFGFVFPLFILFFWFAIARFVFWGGPWRRRWHDQASEGVPPRFEEWHRQVHERMGHDASGTTRT